MAHLQEARLGRLFCLRFDPGEDLLLALRGAVRERDIRHAALLDGVGSLDRYHVHVVGTAALPPENTFMREDGPVDILAVTGFVLDGRVHAHLTVSDARRAVGGHLEEGCRVLTFAVVMIAETEGIDLAGWDTVGPL